MTDNNYCLILAGGNGSRLWPVSRTTRPKQFMDLLGLGRTMLQLTYDRISQFIEADHIFISTNMQYMPIVREQLPEVDEARILVEPVRRGTLAAVAWGTVMIAKTDPQANVFVTPADQLIQGEQAFQTDVQKALEFVSSHEALLVTGIRPTRPETGYGYIQTGEDEIGCEGICPVKSFTEKPNDEFARMFMEEGDFLWNAGLFYFNVNVMLSNLYRLVPEYQVEIPRMMAEAESANPRMVPEFFSSLPNLNVDISILERSEHVYVQEGHFGWTDLGTWASLYDDTPKDGDGNVLLNTKAFLYDCQDNIIRLPEGRTAVIKGLKDYAIAEEGEILMICPREDVAAMRRMHTDTKFS
ncbi:MAG: NTP transferase domain-containing protein [Bacteroidaceae bacterium]|nr:NTP transferase domain-containing protein [Bacteroidaceae bacterium]